MGDTLGAWAWAREMGVAAPMGRLEGEEEEEEEWEGEGVAGIEGLRSANLSFILLVKSAESFHTNIHPSPATEMLQ